MQNMLLFFLFILFMDGVSGSNETESVMEGDSVTLLTDLTEIQNDDTILWMFGPKDSVVSQITRKAGLTSFFVTDDVRFRGRLLVDQKTGSLTIRKTRIRHSGQYKLTISREKTTIKIFSVKVFGVVGETDEVKSETVMEGESVTLQNNVLVERDDLIVWRFGDKGILLAKIDVETKEISLNDDDERFRDRLQLDKTGSLIIKKTKTENAGFYELQIRGRESSQRFLLSVTAVPGLSPGLIAGSVVAILLVAVVLAAVVIYYRRKISELKKKDASDKPVKKGQNVCLGTTAEIQEGDLLLWMFYKKTVKEKPKKILVATNATWPNKPNPLRSNVDLDKNGYLLIKNITTEDAGLYKILIINSEKVTCMRFDVNLTDATLTDQKGIQTRTLSGITDDGL